MDAARWARTGVRGHYAGVVLMTTNGSSRPPQAVRWPTAEPHPITRVGAPPRGMSWGDRLLVALILAAGVGGVAGGVVLTGGLFYVGWQVAAELLRRAGH